MEKETGLTANCYSTAISLTILGTSAWTYDGLISNGHAATNDDAIASGYGTAHDDASVAHDDALATNDDALATNDDALITYDDDAQLIVKTLRILIKLKDQSFIE
jgi:hypothetical protein